MKRGTTTYPSAKLASYPFGRKFVLDKGENNDIAILLPGIKFLDLLVMLDMAYSMADCADDEHTKHEISLMVMKLIDQYNKTQSEWRHDSFEWASKCYAINHWGEEE